MPRASQSIQRGSAENAGRKRSPRSSQNPKTKAGASRTKASKKTPPAGVRRAGRRAAEAEPAVAAPAARAARRKPPAKAALAQPSAAPIPVVEPGPLEPGALTVEERIESAKYLVPGGRRRVFEEERFLFPETYGVDRVRLHVKDPDWLFAHWDVSPSSWTTLRNDLGERAVALSRLTLKVEDPSDGALSVVLLPPGARSWYVRTHRPHRTYRAHLGLTTPAGEFRKLATSNVVVTPQLGPAKERASHVARFGRASRHLPKQAAARRHGRVPSRHALGTASGHEPEAVEVIDATTAEQPVFTERGGASDVFRPGGASDLFRR